MTHGKCFAQRLTCSRHSVNISFFYAGEKEGVLRPMGEGQGSVRQQKVDPIVCLLCGLVDSCMQRPLTTVVLI